MFTNFPIAPPQASNFAVEHDWIFYSLVALTFMFTAVVGFMVLYFAIKYRVGNKVDRSRPMYENLKLELTLTIVPLIIGLVMFFFGARLFISMRTPPENAEEVFVIGKQWMWHIQHQNGVRENNVLHVPVGKPVKVTMISQDVLHAFYIPAFRVQMHVVPGRYTQLWFTPTKAGEYHLFCGMYCGTQHSEMGGKVVAMPASEYAEWMTNGGQSTPPLTMAQAGARVFNRLQCGNCHSEQDTARAPSLIGLMNRTRMFADGKSLKADEAYIRESILHPYDEITRGYDRTMPEYEGNVTEEEVLDLIAYIKAMGAGGESIATSPVDAIQASANAAGGGYSTSASKPDVSTPMAVGAIREEQPSRDVTPTSRTNSPAVGAIAAEGSK